MAARPLIVVVTLLASPGARAQAPEIAPPIDPSIGHVDVVLDLPKDVPYVGEMIVLRMRTTVRGDVALDDIRQPPLTNFNWQQLGRDKPIRVMADGFNVPGYERDIAIFPQQAGRLIIDPFVRHVTMVVGANQRVVADFASKPVYVDVQRHEGVSQPGDWWLPAKAVTFTETWSGRPDSIEPGKVARRTVVIEAVGITADRLPPAPLLRAPGLITFTGPATRETIVTADGPVARATYQWDIRPVSNSPAKLPAIHIPWFDTSARHMRDTAIPDQWISYVGAEGGLRRAPDPSTLGRMLASGPLVAGLAGFIWATAVAGLAATSKPGRGLRAGLLKPSGLRAMAKAARRQDATAVKAALMALARSDPNRWRGIATAPNIAQDLALLDAALYGKTAGAVPDLRALAKRIERLWRTAAGSREPDGIGLMPLDGDHAEPRSLRFFRSRNRL